MQPNPQPAAPASNTTDELTTAEVLAKLHTMLSTLDQEPRDLRCVLIPVADVRAVGVLLLGSLRLADEAGKALVALPLQEREATTHAYQEIRRAMVMTMRRVESTLDQLK